MNCRSCGFDFGDGSALEKVGWQNLHDGEGGYALLVNCSACRTTLSLREIADAAKCHVCHRVVTGRAEETGSAEETDPKVHELVVDAETRTSSCRVYCRRCASRTGVGYQAVSVFFLAWVRHGDEVMLAHWRSLWPGHRFPQRKAG